MVLMGSVFMNLPAETILPAIVFFSVAAYRLVTAASQMIGARVKALNDLESLRRVAEIVRSADEREIGDRGEPLTRIDTDIVLRGVDYRYLDGVPVLADVHAVIPRARVTYLVGPSGSGKSTLLDLLLRLIEPSAGSIEANGRVISAFRLDDWRRAFGYVSQDAALFNGSIRMNLLLARPDAGEAELLEACRLAGADAVLEGMPQGLDSSVGDRGYSLSGGERKRIAIARALVSRPSVLILDEATTSFEHSLELEMLARLRAARPDLTVVQVTHRLQSLGQADWVIALEAGRVTTIGPPAQVTGFGARVPITEP
jgi:ABC-type bacteriocin/lantibiotic exporter with double-glycine peptidase domain